jgi:hypothetical protein
MEVRDMANELSFARFDCESEFDRTARDFEFAYALMEQNREMERFVNESLILASDNKRAINEMAIINEAAAGDKIRGFFEKIKNFFKKIFDKLGASMNALFMEQKKYIEQYQYIITKCKWQVGDVSDIYDHFKGLPRIIDVVDKGEPAIYSVNADKFLKGDKITENADAFLDSTTNWNDATKITEKLNDLKKNPVDPNKVKADAFEDFIKQGYWQSVGLTKENDGNGNPSPNATFKAWFNGSVDTTSYSGDEIETNFQTIINTCYAGTSYLNKLEKIVTTVQKKMDSAAKAMEDYHKAQSEKIMAAAKNAKPQNDTKPENNTPQQQNQDKPEGGTAQQNNKQKVKKSEVTLTQNADKSWTATAAGFTGTGGNENGAITDLASKVNQSDTHTFAANESVILNELNFGGNSSSNPDKGQTLTGAGNDQVKNAGETNTNLGKATVNKMDAKDINVASGVDAQVKELLDIDIRNREASINGYVMISTAIATEAFNAFKLTNKDFFDILKAHVQWYLANPGAEKDSANITTRVRNLSMNATTASVNSNQGEAKPAAGGSTTTTSGT